MFPYPQKLAAQPLACTRHSTGPPCPSFPFLGSLGLVLGRWSSCSPCLEYLALAEVGVFFS